MKRKVTAETLARLKAMRRKFGLGEFAPRSRRKIRRKATRNLPRGNNAASSHQSFLLP